MDDHRAPFLTAEWRYLAMLNYPVDAKALAPLLPAGTELDLWKGRAYVSMVGFLFINTRVLGVPIPFHLNFEEVNLRFYVRRKAEAEAGWRRAVVFVKELVPRAAIAWVARTVYGENYQTLPMRHELELDGDTPRRVVYAWTFGGREQRIEVKVQGAPQPLAAGSEPAYIAEHYWGYTKGRDGRTTEYRVEHPPWRAWPAVEAKLDCDAGELYGPGFADALAAPPASAFLADGSAVTVYKGVVLAAPP